MKGFNLEEDDLVSLGGGVLVAAVAFTMFFQSYTLGNAWRVVLAALVAVGARETGQRVLANRMNAEMESVLSYGGSLLSLMAGALAVAFEAPIALVLPLYSEFESERYKQWGYEIDVMWSKRKYWLGAVGITSVLVAWIPFYFLDMTVVSKSLAVFALSQMLPLNETELFDGRTDGAHVLIHSGFVWLILAGLSLAGVILPV